MVLASNERVKEEDLLDIPLTLASNIDTTYEGQVTSNDASASYSRVGTIGLTISTTHTPLIAALNPVTADLDYVKAVLADIVAIPEVTLALTNRLNSVPDMNVGSLIAQFQAATDIPTALGLVTNALGLGNVQLVPTIDGISLVINDATSLEKEGLLNVTVESLGTYVVESPLFNYLGVNDSVKVMFDYQADDGAEIKTETVTLEVQGSKDDVDILKDLPPMPNENLIVNGSFEDITLSGSWGYYNEDEVPGWQTGNVIEAWGATGPAKASHGDNLIELDSNSGLDSISQELNLKAGKYVLEFDAANRGNIDSTNDFKVIFNGQEMIITSDMMKNNSQWTTFSFEFDVPSDGSYDIRFEELSESNDGFGTLLDNIQFFAQGSQEIPDINMASLLSNVIDEATIIPSGENEREVDLSILSNISIDEVVSMTDSNNILQIQGDGKDSLSLDLGAEVLDASEILSGDMQWHKDSDDSTTDQEMYVGKTSTDETVILLIQGLNIEDV